MVLCSGVTSQMIWELYKMAGMEAGLVICKKHLLALLSLHFSNEKNYKIKLSIPLWINWGFISHRDEFIYRPPDMTKLFSFEGLFLFIYKYVKINATLAHTYS